jgi:hypothetical protein
MGWVVRLRFHLETINDTGRSMVEARLVAPALSGFHSQIYSLQESCCVPKRSSKLPGLSA